MNLAELIGTFAGRYIVPVDVDEVVAVLRENGVKDHIWFWPVEIDDTRLRGAFVQWEPWEYPEGDDVKNCVDIHYAKTLANDWQRFVSCKELLHILDSDALRTDTEDKVLRLLEKIVLPAELQNPLKDGVDVNGDRVAEVEALAILFPFETRQLFHPPFKAGKLSAADIAKWVDIPERYVALAMSDIWPAIHGLLTGEAVENGA